MKQLILLLVSLLLFPVASPAQKQKEHPIDRALEACIEKDSTTAGMTNCQYKAGEMWDKELNRVYNQLAGKLDTEGRQALKAAQMEWIKQRDTEYGLVDAIYSHLEGTIHIPARVAARTEIVRTRAMALKDYLDLLKEQ